VRCDELVEALRGRDVRDPDPEVVDVAGRPHRAVVHGFGAVSVGVEQEPAVVLVPVLSPRAGGAVVPIAGRGPDAPELIHLCT